MSLLKTLVEPLFRNKTRNTIRALLELNQALDNHIFECLISGHDEVLRGIDAMAHWIVLFFYVEEHLIDFAGFVHLRQIGLVTQVQLGLFVRLQHRKYADLYVVFPLALLIQKPDLLLLTTVSLQLFLVAPQNVLFEEIILDLGRLVFYDQTALLLASEEEFRGEY